MGGVHFGFASKHNPNIQVKTQPPKIVLSKSFQKAT